MPTVKQYQEDPLAKNRELLKNPSIQSMLRTIRYAEGTAGDRGYNTRVGNSQFDDLSKKPGLKVYIPSIKDFSSAEGAYQFLNSTWEGVSKKLGLKDFSPESQDLAAVELIKNRGALQDVLNNNLTGALTKLSSEWASLPTSKGKSAYSNQKSKKVEDLSNVFYGKGVDYTNSVAPYINTPQVAITPLQVPKIQEEQSNPLYSPTTFATPEKEVTIQTEEPKQNTAEQSFMQDLLGQMMKGVAYIEPEKSTEFQDGGTASDTIRINDTRKIRATTNKPINPNVDLVTGNYKSKTIEDIVNASLRNGVDPDTALALAMQESKLGNTDENLGHIVGGSYRGEEANDMTKLLSDKMYEGRKLGKRTDEQLLQMYNGTGKIFPTTEQDYHGFKMKQAYGVPIPKEGIDMSKTPLYGKQVIDIRDNVIKKNKIVADTVKNLKGNFNHFEGAPYKKLPPMGEEIFQPNAFNNVNPKYFQDGGNIVNNFRAEHPSVRDLRTDLLNKKIQEHYSKNTPINTRQKDNTNTIKPKVGNIATQKEIIQRAEKENKTAYENSKKQANKDYVEKNMGEVYQHPLWSLPGTVTPEGVAVMAMQGAAKITPDLYNKDYKSAGMDALMMLPLAPGTVKAISPVIKNAGRILGTQDGLLSNAYKLNPLSFKPNPEAYYRVIGKEGYADVIENNIIRPKVGSSHSISYPTFKKGVPLDGRYASSEIEGLIGDNSYMIESNGNKMIQNNWTAHAPDKDIFLPRRELTLNNEGVNIYKKDWLQGYKEVPKSESNPFVSKLQNLEKEIDNIKTKEASVNNELNDLTSQYKNKTISAEVFSKKAKELNLAELTYKKGELEKLKRTYSVQKDIHGLPQENILHNENQLGANISDGGSNNRGVFEVDDKYVAKLNAHGYDDASRLLAYKDKIKSDRIAKTVQVKNFDGKVYQVQQKATGTPISKMTEGELKNIPKKHIDSFWKDKKELDNLGLSIDISGGKSNIIYDKNKGFQFIDLGIGKSPDSKIINEVFPILKLQQGGTITGSEKNFLNDFFKEGGEVIEDNNGYWNPNNWGKNVKIDGGEITMEKVGVPLVGRANTGETKLMLPEQNYSFRNATYVIESPLTKEEQLFLQEYGKLQVAQQGINPLYKVLPKEAPTIESLLWTRPDLKKGEGIYYGEGDNKTFISPSNILSEVVVKAKKKQRSREFDNIKVKNEDLEAQVKKDGTKIDNKQDIDRVLSDKISQAKLSLGADKRMKELNEIAPNIHIAIKKSDVIEIQKKLYNLGYDLGDYGKNKDGIDGLMGKKTKEALDEYNKTKGVASGKLSLEQEERIARFKQPTKSNLDNTVTYLSDKKDEVVGKIKEEVSTVLPYNLKYNPKLDTVGEYNNNSEHKYLLDNKSLSDIRKEKNISFLQISKDGRDGNTILPLQFKERVVNSTNAQGYAPDYEISKEGINFPFFDRLKDEKSKTQVVKGLEGDKGNKREDIYRMYSGLPQKNDTFTASSFKAGKYSDTNVTFKNPKDVMDYLKIAATHTDLFEKLASGQITPQTIANDAKSNKKGAEKINKAAFRDPKNVMWNATFGVNFDKQGNPYLSFYDNWDLKGKDDNVVSGAVFGKPIEVYDRIPLSKELVEKLGKLDYKFTNTSDSDALSETDEKANEAALKKVTEFIEKDPKLKKEYEKLSNIVAQRYK